MNKLILSATLCIAMTTVVSGADVSTNHLEKETTIAASDTMSLPVQIPKSQLAIKALPRETDKQWPIRTKNGLANYRGVLEFSDTLGYVAAAPSYIPYGYHYYTSRRDVNDVLEIVYRKKGHEYQERSGHWVDSIMAFRMGYSIDTVRDVAYNRSEYFDVEWIESTSLGDVIYTGNVDTNMVRSITWSKDGLSYFLFFMVPVKASKANFYKDNVVQLSSIDSNRHDLVGTPIDQFRHTPLKEHENQEIDYVKDFAMDVGYVPKEKIEWEPKEWIDPPPSF